MDSSKVSDLAYFMTNLPLEWPKEYVKPTLVVPDIMVESMREAFGDGVRVVPISETMLPQSDGSGDANGG